MKNTVSPDMHPDGNALRELFEQGLQASDAKHIVAHLKHCTECTRKIQRLRTFDRLMRRSLAESAPRRITHNVLKELGIPEEQSFAWRVFQYAAPIVALFMVTAVIVAAFYFAGAFRQPEIQSSISAGQTAYTGMEKAVSQGSGALTGWMKQYFSFAVVGKGTGLTAFIALFFIVIALLDKFFFAPMLRRKAGIEHR